MARVLRGPGIGDAERVDDRHAGALRRVVCCTPRLRPLQRPEPRRSAPRRRRRYRLRCDGQTHGRQRVGRPSPSSPGPAQRPANHRGPTPPIRVARTPCGFDVRPRRTFLPDRDGTRARHRPQRPAEAAIRDVAIRASQRSPIRCRDTRTADHAHVRPDARPTRGATRGGDVTPRRPATSRTAPRHAPARHRARRWRLGPVHRSHAARTAPHRHAPTDRTGTAPTRST